MALMNNNKTLIPVIDRTMVSYQEPVCNDGTTVEDLIASFVKAKFARTQSTKTAKAYVETLRAFPR